MIVRTYKDLEFYVNMFRDGNSELLVIVGDGGIGKSRIVDDIMKDIEHVKILSHITPMSLFITGYTHANIPIIFDDVDTLLNNKECVALLKQFCETSQTKEIQWTTTSKILEIAGIPSRYETKTQACIIGNDFRKLNKMVGALIDRGFLINFQPTVSEILSKIDEIKNNMNNGLTVHEMDEVFELIQKFAKFGNVTLRTFIKGNQLYKQCNGNDGWEERLLAEMEIESKLQIIDRLLKNFKTDKERLIQWYRCGWSRRSYYGWKGKIVKKCISKLDMHI